MAHTEPHRFILQALDPDHGSPVLELLFRVSRLEDLRTLLGGRHDDDLRFGCALDTNELAAINDRFGLAFDPQGRETSLDPWHWMREIPYLSHNGYELPLMLEERKPFARMSDVYPPESNFNEAQFDRYVAQGLLHKEVVVEPFAKPLRVQEWVYDGKRTVYYTRNGEEWRIPASKLIWSAAEKSQWNDDFERMEGMLYGYEEWQIDWWIAYRRERRKDLAVLPAAP